MSATERNLAIATMLLMLASGALIGFTASRLTPHASCMTAILTDEKISATPI